METVVVSTEVFCAQKKRYSAINSPYNIDFWKEVKKRWLVFGVLAAVLLAVISPRFGAPGGKQPACSFVDHSRTHCTHLTILVVRTGPLYPEYLSYVPSSIIYFGAGARLVPRAARAPPRLPLRLAAAAALHAHVAAPALCVCAVTMFGDALHPPVVSGALLSSLGGGCAWLTLALSRHGAAAPVAAGCYLSSLVATPLSVLLLCGRTTIPPLSDVVSSALGALLPFAAGAAAARRRPPPAQPAAAQHAAQHAAHAAALALVYTECCARLADAAGSLYVGDVLATLLVEVSWVCAVAGACGVYARWWGAGGARLIAACAVPRGLHDEWGAAAACGAPALARLPGVFAAPAQALLLAAVHCGHDADADGWPDRPDRPDPPEGAGADFTLG